MAMHLSVCSCVHVVMWSCHMGCFPCADAASCLHCNSAWGSMGREGTGMRWKGWPFPSFVISLSLPISLSISLSLSLSFSFSLSLCLSLFCILLSLYLTSFTLTLYLHLSSLSLSQFLYLYQSAVVSATIHCCPPHTPTRRYTTTSNSRVIGHSMNTICTTQNL